MGRSRVRAYRDGPERCLLHGKSVYTSEGSAIAAAREVERREGTEPGAMSWYRCEESKGWHIGHRSIRDRLSR